MMPNATMTAEPPQAATATSHQPLIDPASDENPADESRRSPAHRPELHRSSGIFRSVCIASDPIWTKTETPRYPMLRAPPTFRNSSEALSADSSPSRSEEHTSELQSLMRISY